MFTYGSTPDVRLAPDAAMAQRAILLSLSVSSDPLLTLLVTALNWFYYQLMVYQRCTTRMWWCELLAADCTRRFVLLISIIF